MILPIAQNGTAVGAAGTPKLLDIGTQRKMVFGELLQKTHAAQAKLAEASSPLPATTEDLQPRNPQTPPSTVNSAAETATQPPAPAPWPGPADTQGWGDPPPEPPAGSDPLEPFGFIRSDGEGPLRYREVPEFAKAPFGPYYQAPPEYGGEWWKVTPFTSSQPWKILDGPFLPPEDILPEGFEGLFGTRPQRVDFNKHLDFQKAEILWEQSLKYFKGVGIPEGIDPAALQTATEVVEEWGLGTPQFYEGRYGWQARFPDSRHPGFEINPTTLVMAPHVTVARYQLGLLELGILPETFHSFIPPSVIQRFTTTAPS
jgi:hypothetical protein